MLQIEVLVRKGFGAVYAGGPSSIAVEEIATLAHELGDLGEIFLSKSRTGVSCVSPECGEARR